MTAVEAVYGVLLGVGLFFGVGVCMVRNAMVARYRRGVLDDLHALNQREIDRGVYDHYMDRYAIWRTFSYGRMVLEFWRPMRSFRLRERLGVGGQQEGVAEDDGR